MSSPTLRAVKGMNDILPDEVGRWQHLEQAFRGWFERLGFREVRTPQVEPTSLFVRSIGEATDVVEKEMYSFRHHDEELTLRPEGTAGAARAYIEHQVKEKSPVSRWYYLGPMFRGERPARGRYRQFHQAGCEVYGDPGPVVDAELIDALVGFLQSVGLQGIEVALSSLGGPGARARYRDALVEYFRPHAASLSEDSLRRLETNPLRILDSKDPGDQALVAGAPSIQEQLDGEDRAHFEQLRRHLDALGTPYQIDPRLVRGLDYYTRTLFEIRGNGGELGAQNAVCGGGRYDRMIEELGGRPTPCIGFALGMERLLLATPAVSMPTAPLVFLAPLGERAQSECLLLARELRSRGVEARVEGRGQKLKAVLARASDARASHCVILGEGELDRGLVALKDLRAQSQQELPRAQLVEHLCSQLHLPLPEPRH